MIHFIKPISKNGEFSATGFRAGSCGNIFVFLKIQVSEFPLKVGLSTVFTGFHRKIQKW